MSILSSIFKNIIRNIRFGFATNSSSSHSFVYMKKPNNDLGSAAWMNVEFGWEDFELRTIREKLMYHLVMRGGSSWGSDPDDLYDNYWDEYPELDKEDFEAAASGYVDHESYGTITLDQARDPHVVVFGGNDNGGSSANRRAAIRNGEVDWDKTKPEWGDMEAIESAKGLPARDVEKFHAKNYENNSWEYSTPPVTSSSKTVNKTLYHISPKTNRSGQCRAHIKPCPFGLTKDEHFESKAAANEHIKTTAKNRNKGNELKGLRK